MRLEPGDYAYDDANQLTSVTDWDSNVTGYAYDDAGRMTTATLPSGTGIVSTYAYDDANRLTSINHVKGGLTTVASVSYTLDDVGNRTQRVDQQGTHDYEYDDLYRLTEVTYPGPSTTSYEFDEFGNRTEMTDGSGTTTYAYDDADRLTSLTKPGPTTVNYTWNDNGDLTARGGDSFTWNYEDRMTSATVNSVTTNFTYRGDGLRNSRQTGMTTTTFTWDVAAGLPAVIDDGNQYVYGATGLGSMKQAGDWYYYLADGLGSTMAIVDNTGAVVNSYTYDVYGDAMQTGSLPNEFDFAGQQTDSTGLQYLRARYMDPQTGTFISRDDLSNLAHSIGNSHAYSGGNPTGLVDPMGEWPWSGCGGLCWKAVDIPELAPSGSIWIEQLFVANGGTDHYRICSLIDEKPVCDGFVSRKQLIHDVTLSDYLQELFPQIAALAGTFGDIAAQIANGHAFAKHWEDYDFKDRTEFAEEVQRVMQNAKGRNVRQLSNNRTAYFDSKTGNIVIHDPNSTDGGTMFRGSFKQFSGLN